jgi:hypothetical protein
MCSSDNFGQLLPHGIGDLEEGGGNVDLVGSDEHDIAFVCAL